MQEITPCLWFKTEAEEAAQLYVSVFGEARILEVERFGEGAPQPSGSVMTISFELRGQRFLALNGRPDMKFNESISLQVGCDTQDEVDHLWKGLTDGGEESMCGWLRDRYGVSWQIVPRRLTELLRDPDPARARRAMQAMLQMRKIDINVLEQAAGRP